MNVKGDSLVIKYRYDASGNRVEKQVVLESSTKATRYIRDASGNVMGIYQDTTLTEQPLYGSSRLGQYQGGIGVGIRKLGLKNYELSNHLGNVLAVVSDKVVRTADGALAKVNSVSDYTPFGLAMKGRTWSNPAANQPRYGFNGKEDDRETSTQDYGFRIYYPRIGKFLSVDPLTKQYPELTPYQFASNRPIDGIDLDGLEWLNPGLMFARPMPMLEPVSELAVGRAAPMGGSMPGPAPGGSALMPKPVSVPTSGFTPRIQPLVDISAQTQQEQQEEKEARNIFVGTQYRRDQGNNLVAIHNIIGIQNSTGDMDWYEQTYLDQTQNKVYTQIGGYQIQSGPGEFIKMKTDRFLDMYQKLNLYKLVVAPSVAEKAHKLAEGKLGENTYNTVLNSCVTNVKDILNPVGYSIPFWILTPEALKQKIEERPGETIKVPNIPLRKN